jgi:hypothetical protein
MRLIYSLGDLSTWAESIMQAYESASSEQITRCPDLQTLQAAALSTGGIPVVLVENAFGSQKWIKSLRESRVRAVVVWFGKTFSKEDFVFANQQRVYATLETLSVSDSRFADAILRAEDAANGEEEMQHLLRTLKTAILQRAQGDQETELLTELKAVVSKMEKCSHANELVGLTSKSAGSESRLPLHQSAALSDALTTISDLERTGILQVVCRSIGEEGSVQFLQGKAVRATAGAVTGVKAIYRMFLWPNYQFQFVRQQASEVSVEESIGIVVRDLCILGEKLRKEFTDIRQNVPPPSLRLELDPTVLNVSSRLEPDLFSTLASVVEFGKVAQVLDYNGLPDVNLYQALIGLRRKRLLRVMSNS